MLQNQSLQAVQNSLRDQLLVVHFGLDYLTIGAINDDFSKKKKKKTKQNETKHNELPCLLEWVNKSHMVLLPS